MLPSLLYLIIALSVYYSRCYHLSQWKKHSCIIDNIGSAILVSSIYSDQEYIKIKVKYVIINLRIFEDSPKVWKWILDSWEIGIKGSSFADEGELVHNYIISNLNEGHYIPFISLYLLKKYKFKILFHICQKCKAVKLFILLKSIVLGIS